MVLRSSEVQVIISSFVIRSADAQFRNSASLTCVYLDSSGGGGGTAGDTVGTAYCVVSTDTIGVFLANTIGVWCFVIVVCKVLEMSWNHPID